MASHSGQVEMRVARLSCTWRSAAGNGIVAVAGFQSRPRGEHMRSSARTVSWRALAPGFLLAALGAGACAGADAPAPATESEAVAAPEATSVRGAYENVPDPGATFTDERGLTVEGMGIDFCGAPLSGLRGLPDRTGAGRAAA